MRLGVITQSAMAAWGIGVMACSGPVNGQAASQPASQPAAKSGNQEIVLTQKPWAQAVFAGGCFWCIESAFDELPGVNAAISGYTGGQEVAPTYRQVAGKRSDHMEAV